MVVEIQPEDLGNEELKMRNEELAAQQDEQLMALNPNLKSSQLSEINSQLLSVLHFQEELERQCWLQGGRRQTLSLIHICILNHTNCSTGVY